METPKSWLEKMELVLIQEDKCDESTVCQTNTTAVESQSHEKSKDGVKISHEKEIL